MKAERIQPGDWARPPAKKKAAPRLPEVPETLPRRRPNVSDCNGLAQVVAVVINATGVSFQELSSSSKLPRQVLARGMIAALARVYAPGASYPFIARSIGKRCHTTVMKAECRMRALIEIPLDRQSVIDWGGMPIRVAELYWHLAGQVEAALAGDEARRAEMRRAAETAQPRAFFNGRQITLGEAVERQRPAV